MTALVPATRTTRRGLPPATVIVGAVIGSLVLIFVTLGTGVAPVSPFDVLQTVAGNAPENEFAVLDVGLPRALLAVLCGMALGVGGALMQAHTRNPLGTPDVIGFTAGASVGAVIALVPLHLKGTPVSIAALIGGAVTAVVVFALAGGAHRAGYRLIVVGIGVTAMLMGVTSYMLSRAEVATGLDAQRWLAGSLNNATWTEVSVMLVAVAVLLPAGMALRRPLLVTDLGDEAAIGLGVPLKAVGGCVVAVSVLTAAVVVSTLGPIGFIDLAAPQVAIRLIRLPGPLVASSAVVGGFALLAADLLAQRALPDDNLPVGIATGVVGGIYLAWLLTRIWRKNR